LSEFTIENARRERIRVDSSIWDTQDARYNIIGRDDVANLQRMYYKLFKNVLINRWPNGSTWELFPDEHTEMDWENVHNFLGRAEISSKIRRDLLTEGKFKILIRHEFKILKIQPVRSHENPLVQLADFFVGLGIYSKENFFRYKLWKRENHPQRTFFEPETEKFSNAEQERFTVLDNLNYLCKTFKLGVSLNREKCLKTFDPKRPINFWWYESQNEMDKAPTRNP
jgi:hypothetical protein